MRQLKRFIKAHKFNGFTLAAVHLLILIAALRADEMDSMMWFSALFWVVGGSGWSILHWLAQNDTKRVIQTKRRIFWGGVVAFISTSSGIDEGLKSEGLGENTIYAVIWTFVSLGWCVYHLFALRKQRQSDEEDTWIDENETKQKIYWGTVIVISSTGYGIIEGFESEFVGTVVLIAGGLLWAIYHLSELRDQRENEESVAQQ